MAEDIITESIHIAKQIAKDNFNAKCSPGHLMKALLNRQFSFIKELDTVGVDVFYLEE